MKFYAIKTILFTLLFPVAPLRAGLNKQGFSLTDEDSSLRSKAHLGVGFLMGLLAFYFMMERPHDPSFRLRSDNWTDRVLSAEGFTRPFENYGAFWSWLTQVIPSALSSLGDQISSYTDPAATFLKTVHFSALGYDLTGGALALIFVLLPITLWVIYTEVRVKIMRSRLKSYSDKFFQMDKELSAVLATLPDGMSDAEIQAELDKVRVRYASNVRPDHSHIVGAITGPADGAGLSFRLKLFTRRFLNDHAWLRNYELFEYKMGDIFLASANLIIPAVAFPFVVLLLVPLLLMIGVWLLLIAGLLIGFLPFAFLQASGIRMRLH